MASDLSPERRPGIRPRPSWGRRLDAAARRSAPVGFTALAILLLSAPLGLPEQEALLPGTVLASVFFWSMFRPASMPGLAVFALGLLSDLLGYAPPGITIVILLVVHGIGLAGRYGLAKQGFLLVWLVFLLVAAGATLLDWTLRSGFSLRVLPLQPALFQLGLAAGLYPLWSGLFTWAHRTIADPARA
jgi:rod shape-determining protein MreD